MIQGDPYPFGVDFIGEDGRGEGLLEDEVPSAVWQDIKPFHIPSMETFTWIHKRIEKATHVSSYPQQLVIELAKIPDEEFESLLEELPETIGCLSAGYVNGSLLAYKTEPQKSPNPKVVDSEYHDVGYLDPNHGGILKPGLLLECAGIIDSDQVRRGNMLTNSGVKVKKAILIE